MQVLHWGLNLTEAFEMPISQFGQTPQQPHAPTATTTTFTSATASASAPGPSPQTQRLSKTIFRLKRDADVALAHSVDVRITTLLRAWASNQASRALADLPGETRAVSALQQEFAGMLMEQVQSVREHGRLPGWPHRS